MQTAKPGEKPDFSAISDPVERARAEGLFNAGTAVLINDIAYNTPAPVVPPATVQPPFGGGAVTQPGTVPPQNDPSFADQFDAWKAKQTGGTDFAAEEARLRAEEAARMEAIRAAIRASSERTKTEATEAGMKREQGTQAGLGMTQGLNWSSTGQDELWNIGQDTVKELKKIDLATAEALASADAKGFEATAAALKELRAQKETYSKNLWDQFNEMTKTTILQQQADRQARNLDVTEADKKRDDARAVLTNVLNSFTGADLGSLPASVREGLTKLEVEAGYPAGFVEQGLSTLKELKLNQDQQQLDQTTALKQQQLLLQAVLQAPKGVTVNLGDLGSVVGTDPGAVAPAQKLQSRSQIVDKTTGNVVGFLNVYGDGSSKPVDMVGQPISLGADPSKYEFRTIRQEESTPTDIFSQYGFTTPTK